MPAYRLDDVGAAVASGSFKTMGMVAIPCSMKTLSGVANSHSDNLLFRPVLFRDTCQILAWSEACHYTLLSICENRARQATPLKPRTDAGRRRYDDWDQRPAAYN